MFGNIYWPLIIGVASFKKGKNLIKRYYLKSSNRLKSNKINACRSICLSCVKNSEILNILFNDILNSHCNFKLVHFDTCDNKSSHSIILPRSKFTLKIFYKL